jgi:uncharacterized damage-inducible protein DinB
MPIDLATVAENEYAPPFAPYLARLGGACHDLVAQLAEQGSRTSALLAGIPEERAGFRYAPGKWSIRDMVGHLADSERILVFRALCVARGEQTARPGFDEAAYAATAGADRRTLADLAAELAMVRAATVAFFSHLDAPALARRGTANQYPTTPRALAAVIAGHELHHLAILEERYLKAAR